MTRGADSLSQHSSNDEDRHTAASRQEVNDLAYMLSAVSDRIDDHDNKVAALVADSVRTVLEGLPAALEKSIVSAFDACIHDEERIGRAIATAGGVMKRRAAETAGGAMGGFVRTLFTRWLLYAVAFLWLAKVAGWDAAAKIWSAIKGP